MPRTDAANVLARDEKTAVFASIDKFGSIFMNPVNAVKNLGNGIRLVDEVTATNQIIVIAIAKNDGDLHETVG